jgi:hypothetical protein
MIRRQLVQWVLLPNGLTADDQLAASVFVAPRLRPDAPATLEQFPDFADWPAVLGSLNLVLELAGGATEAPLRITANASGGLWSALFPPETTVRAFRFENVAYRPLVSYPVDDVLGYLRSRWAWLAEHALDELPVTSRNAAPIGRPPPVEGEEGRAILSNLFEELRAVGDEGIFRGAAGGVELSDRLRGVLDSAAAEARQNRESGQPALIQPFGYGGSAPEALYALAGFHARPAYAEPPEVPVDGEEQREHAKPKDFPADAEQARAELAETLDFHHHLSLLGDHPALLRRLGLVIDLEIRPDFVPVTSDTDPATLLRLRVERPSSFPPRSDDPDADTWNADVTPWTSCRLTQIDGQAFWSAAERTARLDFAHGFLVLDPTRYAPVAVDVDGLALKALNMAATLEQQEAQDQRPVEEPDRDGVPSIRTGGVALVHTRRAEKLHGDFQQAADNDRELERDPDNPPMLTAEDLLRSYRLDLWADGGWRSLHARHVTYTPERDPAEAFEAEDEGCIQLSLTAEVDRPDAPADPDRPLYVHEAMATWDGWSLTVSHPGDAIPQEPAAPESAGDLTSMQLRIAAAALPESLPRLRFQSEYRMRVRTVDLAGNSHALSVADNLLVTLEGTGDDRYVAAAPPSPLRYLRFEPVPPPELVPRLPYGPGESLERLVIRSAPGQTAESYAEASLEAGDEFLRFRPFCDRHVAAAKASLQLVETHGLLDEAIDAVRGLDQADAAAAAQPFYDIASRESRSFDASVDADAVELPYLPDPLCAGAKARLWLQPGEPEQVLEIEFGDGGGWYCPQPIRLRLEEGEFTVQFDAEQRLLAVGLPQGRTGRLRLSSLFRFDPEIFGILDWCRQLSGSDADQVEAAIKDGTHWMTAPWRDLVLVHAVQRPMESPRFELDLGEVVGSTGIRALARPRGSTAADLFGRLSFDLPSTGRLDVSASWDDVEDDPAHRGARLRPASRDVFSLAVPEPFGTPWLEDVSPLIASPHDGLVEFRTSFHGEPPEHRRLQLLDDATEPTLSVPERRRVEAAAAQLETLRAHELGDTRYRRVTYQSTAATRFREYFDPEMPVAEGTTLGDGITVEVLSSAPPAKPEVLQVLPIMRHDRTETNGTFTNTRKGLGLRVWLRRPWWSSGAGELLAVVCDPSVPHPLGELSREATMILQDPAHASITPQPLAPDAFRNADLTRSSIPFQHGGVHHLDIAGFRPVWDEGRRAWYCDIEFETGAAYFPFVRLGLARYQAMSIPGCELSPIVPTAFVQTVPDRTVTCTLQPGAANVSLTGPAPSSSMDVQGNVVAGTNVVVAVVEEQGASFADPLLGWTATGSETELQAVLNGDGTASWSGAIHVPDADGRNLRLTIREYEIHPADDRSAQPSPGLVPNRRLVHADVIPL